MFMHAVTDGPANQSYGLQVAALAGVPREIIKRARTRLRELEQSAQQHAEQQINQLSLFDLNSNEESDDKENRILDKLESIDPDELTPKQALEQLYCLKKLSES